MKAVRFIALTVTIFSGLVLAAPLWAADPHGDTSTPTDTSRPTGESASDATVRDLQEKVSTCIKQRAGGVSASNSSPSGSSALRSGARSASAY